VGVIQRTRTQRISSLCVVPQYGILCHLTFAPSSHISHSDGGAENDGHENDVPSKLQVMKLQDMKLQDMTRIDSILFNFSFFSCIVMLTLQHGTV